MRQLRHLRLIPESASGSRNNIAVQLAFASSDRVHVDQHFGTAESFSIYKVDVDNICLLEVIQFTKYQQDGNENKLVDKIQALANCVAVYSQAAGASAIAQLKANAIWPIKVSASARITDLLESLQEQLLSGPSAWLEWAIKAKQATDMSRFDDMEAQGWQE